MPVTITQGAAINNYLAPNQARKTSTQNVVAQIQYADIWRGAGTLRNNGVMRVDMQGQIAAAGGVPARQNIQVQVNGVAGHSTVAHADVSHSLQTNDPINQRGVVNKVISALNQSLDSGRSYTVTGSIP
jgi:muconolactone delta-isomerase